MATRGRRRAGRRVPRGTRGGCSRSPYTQKISGYGVTKSIRVKSEKTGKFLAKRKTVTYDVADYCRKKATKRKSAGAANRRTTGRAASRKLCYTKTGLKKSPLKSGRCPQGSNRSRANKDAGTGRKGGYRSSGRRAGSGFVCVSKKTGRWTRKVAGGGCRKGSKRSKRF